MTQLLIVTHKSAAGHGGFTPRLCKAGWLRHQENGAKPRQPAQTGRLVSSKKFEALRTLPTAPSAPLQVATRHFLDRRVHPALQRRGLRHAYAWTGRYLRPRVETQYVHQKVGGVSSAECYALIVRQCHQKQEYFSRKLSPGWRWRRRQLRSVRNHTRAWRCLAPSGRMLRQGRRARR